MHTYVIIDDESKIREVLKLKLDKLEPSLELLGEAANGRAGKELIVKVKPDIVFLDIEMPEMSGLEMLEQWDTPDFVVIFATGYNDYALQALRLSAIDYILKPLRNDDIKDAVQKAISQVQLRQDAKNLERLRNNLSKVGDQSSTIAIADGNTYHHVLVSDIEHCEGWQKYTKIHCIDGHVLISSYSLGHYGDLLESYNFYLCHKSHLINVQAVDSYSKDGHVTMKSGAVIPVSRRRRTDFMNTVMGSQ